jgi:glycosyltransferase involved in cell wall biosynthesis
VSYFHPLESGAERQALAQGRELVRRGHTVHVVTKDSHELPREGEVHGIKIHRWIRTSSSGPLFGLTFVAGVIHALRRLRSEYDVVHTHQGLWEAIATGLGRDLLRRAPVLVQPAASGYYGEAEELTRTKGFPILRRVVLRNRQFAAISADIEHEWRRLGVPEERIVRMASGVDAEHFRPGPSAVELALPPRPRVVFTGRLHPQKNLDLLLEAWVEVAARTSASLILVGWGADRERLEGRSRELGIADRVHFTGQVSDPAEHLRAADLFVLPSIAEGMSNSLLEAMATGLPCLVSAIGGNTDLIDDRKGGLLLSPNDKGAWSSALIELIGNPALARSFGEAARRRIDAEFALPVVVDRYVGLYRDMLAATTRA